MNIADAVLKKVQQDDRLQITSQIGNCTKKIEIYLQFLLAFLKYNNSNTGIFTLYGCQK